MTKKYQKFGVALTTFTLQKVYFVSISLSFLFYRKFVIITIEQHFHHFFLLFTVLSFMEYFCYREEDWVQDFLQKVRRRMKRSKAMSVFFSSFPFMTKFKSIWRVFQG